MDSDGGGDKATPREEDEPRRTWFVDNSAKVEEELKQSSISEDRLLEPHPQTFENKDLDEVIERVDPPGEEPPQQIVGVEGWDDDPLAVSVPHKESVAAMLLRQVDTDSDEEIVGGDPFSSEKANEDVGETGGEAINHSNNFNAGDPVSGEEMDPEGQRNEQDVDNLMEQMFPSPQRATPDAGPSREKKKSKGDEQKKAHRRRPLKYSIHEEDDEEEDDIPAPAPAPKTRASTLSREHSKPRLAKRRSSVAFAVGAEPPQEEGAGVSSTPLLGPGRRPSIVAADEAMKELEQKRDREDGDDDDDDETNAFFDMLDVEDAMDEEPPNLAQTFLFGRRASRGRKVSGSSAATSDDDSSSDTTSSDEVSESSLDITALKAKMMKSRSQAQFMLDQAIYTASNNGQEAPGLTEGENRRMSIVSGSGKRRDSAFNLARQLTRELSVGTLRRTQAQTSKVTNEIMIMAPHMQILARGLALVDDITSARMNLWLYRGFLFLQISLIVAGNGLMLWGKNVTDVSRLETPVPWGLLTQIGWLFGLTQVVYVTSILTVAFVYAEKLWQDDKHSKIFVVGQALTDVGTVVQSIVCATFLAAEVAIGDYYGDSKFYLALVLFALTPAMAGMSSSITNKNRDVGLARHAHLLVHFPQGILLLTLFYPLHYMFEEGDNDWRAALSLSVNIVAVIIIFATLRYQEQTTNTYQHSINRQQRARTTRIRVAGICAGTSTVTSTIYLTLFMFVAGDTIPSTTHFVLAHILCILSTILFVMPWVSTAEPDGITDLKKKSDTQDKPVQGLWLYRLLLAVEILSIIGIDGLCVWAMSQSDLEGMTPGLSITWTSVKQAVAAFSFIHVFYLCSARLVLLINAMSIWERMQNLEIFFLSRIIGFMCNIVLSHLSSLMWAVESRHAEGTNSWFYLTSLGLGSLPLLGFIADSRVTVHQESGFTRHLLIQVPLCILMISNFFVWNEYVWEEGSSSSFAVMLFFSIATTSALFLGLSHKELLLVRLQVKMSLPTLVFKDTIRGKFDEGGIAQRRRQSRVGPMFGQESVLTKTIQNTIMKRKIAKDAMLEMRSRRVVRLLNALMSILSVITSLLYLDTPTNAYVPEKVAQVIPQVTSICFAAVFFVDNIRGAPSDPDAEDDKDEDEEEEQPKLTTGPVGEERAAPIALPDTMVVELRAPQLDTNYSEKKFRSLKKERNNRRKVRRAGSVQSMDTEVMRVGRGGMTSRSSFSQMSATTWDGTALPVITVDSSSPSSNRMQLAPLEEEMTADVMTERVDAFGMESDLEGEDLDILQEHMSSDDGEADSAFMLPKFELDPVDLVDLEAQSLNFVEDPIPLTSRTGSDAFMKRRDSIGSREGALKRRGSSSMSRESPPLNPFRVVPYEGRVSDFVPSPSQSRRKVSMSAQSTPLFSPSFTPTPGTPNMSPMVRRKQSWSINEREPASAIPGSSMPSPLASPAISYMGSPSLPPELFDSEDEDELNDEFLQSEISKAQAMIQSSPTKKLSAFLNELEA